MLHFFEPRYPNDPRSLCLCDKARIHVDHFTAENGMAHPFKPIAPPHERSGYCVVCGFPSSAALHSVVQYVIHTDQGPFKTDAQDIIKDYGDKVEFKSGATSGGSAAPYHYMTWEGVKLTALRFEYGNRKHENSQNILAEANWLKAFHARDIAFFQERISHAIEHIQKESQGNFDLGPGGNWGAVGWCVDVMPFVAKYDPEFYRAIVGLSQLKNDVIERPSCRCPRCQARMENGTQEKQTNPIHRYESKSKAMMTECAVCGGSYKDHVRRTPFDRN